MMMENNRLSHISHWTIMFLHHTTRLVGGGGKERNCQASIGVISFEGKNYKEGNMLDPRWGLMAIN